MWTSTAKKNILHTFAHLTQTLLAQEWSVSLLAGVCPGMCQGIPYSNKQNYLLYQQCPRGMGRNRHDGNYCQPEPLANPPDTQKPASNLLLISHTQLLQRQKAFAIKFDTLLIDGFTCWLLLCANRIQNSGSLRGFSHGAEWGCTPVSNYLKKS